MCFVYEQEDWRAYKKNKKNVAKYKRTMRNFLFNIIFYITFLVFQ